MPVAQLQQALDTVLEGTRNRHPALRIQSWSHSMGEANDLDGWAMGFRLEGLAWPIQCDLYVARIHLKPVVLRSEARWLRTDDFPLEIWSTDESEDPLTCGLDSLNTALEQAIVCGPVRPSNISMLLELSTQITIDKIKLEVRDSLNSDENSIYQAWFRHLHQGNLKPLVIAPYRSTDFHPHSLSQAQQLASLLAPDWGDEGVALIRAMFSGDYIPPTVQGPGLQIEDRDDAWVQELGWWKDFYARNPRGHGVMRLSPVGLVGDHAAIVVYNSTGNADEGGSKVVQSVRLLGSGSYLALFSRVGKGWAFQELRRLPGNWVRQAFLYAELYLHFGDRGRLRMLDNDGDEAGRRLLLRFEPFTGNATELLVMDRTYLSLPRPSFQYSGRVIVVPFLLARTIIPTLEALLAEV